MADYITYFNGEWIPVSQAKIDIADRGFTKGDVVYDVERTFGGIIFQLEHHIDRLYRSLKYVRIDPGMSPQEMIGISEQAVIRNEHLRHEVGDYYVRQFIRPTYHLCKSRPAGCHILCSSLRRRD